MKEKRKIIWLLESPFSQSNNTRYKDQIQGSSLESNQIMTFLLTTALCAVFFNSRLVLF